MMQEPAAEPRAGVDEQVREPPPLERHPHHPLHRVRRNARPRDASHAQRLLVAGARAHAAPDAALEIDVRREGAPALSVPRRGTIAIAATGQARAHREQPTQASASRRGSKPLGFTAASPCRETPCSCSQQQPQQLHTNVGRLMTLSASCTRPRARESARMRSASPRDRPAEAAAHDELGAAVQGQADLHRRVARLAEVLGLMAAEAERDRRRARLPRRPRSRAPSRGRPAAARPRWRPRCTSARPTFVSRLERLVRERRVEAR